MQLLLLPIFLVIFHCDTIMTLSLTFVLNIELKYCLLNHYFHVFILNWIPKLNTNCVKTDMKIPTQSKEKTKITGNTFTYSFCVVDL